MTKRSVAFSLVAALALTVALPSVANAAVRRKVTKPPALTRMTFKMTTREATAGSPVSGSVLLQYRSGKSWLPVSSATITVSVDKVAQGTLTTDASGRATFTHTSSVEGSHSAKLVYAGNASYAYESASQGFTVLAPPVVEEEPVVVEETV